MKKTIFAKSVASAAIIALAAVSVRAATLKVKVVDDTTSAGIEDVAVMAVAFVDGWDEPNADYTQVSKSSPAGAATFSGLAHQDSFSRKITYKIALSKHFYLPSIKEQINNPGIPKVSFLNAGDVNEQFLNNPMRMRYAPSDFRAGALHIRIATTSFSGGELVMLDLRHRITGEPVGFSLQKVQLPSVSSDTHLSLRITNVPPAPANTYRMLLAKMSTPDGVDVVISTAVVNSTEPASGNAQTVALGFVSTSRSDAVSIDDTSRIAFEGVVRGLVSGAIVPVANCTVEIRDTDRSQDPETGRMYSDFNSFRTLSDASGRFVVMKPDTGDIRHSSYSVNVSKLGFKSGSDWGAYPVAGGPGRLYTGSRILLPQYELQEATGAIRGIVTLNGKPLPDAYIWISNEWDKFVGPYNYRGEGGQYSVNTRGDGSFDFIGLAPGQYNMGVNHSVLKGNTDYWTGWERGQNDPNPTEVWNFRYTYNYGEDQRSSRPASAFDPDAGGPLPPDYYRLTDDRRIVITGDTIKSVVYSTSGAVLVVAGGDINVALTVNISTQARIAGNFYFPESVFIASSDAIKVIAHPVDPSTGRWLEHDGRGTVYYADPDGMSGWGNHKPIDIEVSTGTYYVEIKSDKWVPVRSFNTRVTVTEPGSVAVLPPIFLVRAGRLEGKIRLPDGSYFQAKQNSDGSWNSANIEVRGTGVDYRQNTQLYYGAPDPARFVFDALPPGKYDLRIELKKYTPSGGNGAPLYPEAVISGIRVLRGETSFVEAGVKTGIFCEPLLTPEVDYTPRGGPNAAGLYGIIGFPSDFTPKGADIQALMENDGRLEGIYVPFFDYRNGAWTVNGLHAGKYNFYMMFVRMFGERDALPGNDGPPRNNRDACLTLISRAENVDVKSDDLAPCANFQIVMGAGVMGPGIITGSVRGSKILTEADADTYKGNMKELVKGVIPTAMLYDMDGNLRGFSAARPLPVPEVMGAWDAASISGDVIEMNRVINAAASKLEYYIDNVPLGKYVLVCETKNYPPATKVVTISTGATVVNIDFDTDAQAGAGISGRVTDAAGNSIADANVILTHRLVTKKTLTARAGGAAGTFSIPGLPAGSWRIDVTKAGYAPAGTRVSLGKEDKSIAVALTPATAKISGKIYVREGGWSVKNTYAGAKVVAYNETLNVANPTKYLPATTVKTANDGSYIVPDIIKGNTYYVYTFVPERPVYYKRIYVSVDDTTDIDFDVKPSTPTLKVVMKRTDNPYIFRFIVESPRPLVSAPECYYSPGQTYNALAKIRALPTKSVKNSYIVEVEIPSNSDEEYYTLKIRGQYGMNEYMSETVTFSQKSSVKAKKEVADELAEGGSILIDDERSDNTEVKLEPGSLISEEMVDLPVGGFLSALPNVNMSRTSKEISRLMDTVLSDIAASDVYEMKLDRAQINKPFDVALAYDRRKVADDEVADLKVYRYNDVTGKWKAMPGVVTVDPLTATVAVETDNIEQETTSRPAARSVIRSGVYAVNRAASTSQTGMFAVFKNDPESAKNYTGSAFVILNFPNPFDLNAKTVAPDLSDANFTQASITGTLIKYSLPSDKSGQIKLYIYNLAGELVKTIDEGQKTGGYYYYTEWDGKNETGQSCASGVYFLIAKKGSEKLTAKPLKLAIIK